MFEVSGVSVTYQSASGQAVHAVRGVDFSVAGGEFVTIIGPSGCGKSTVLHCMGGLLRPTAGTISFCSVPVEQPDPERYAFVFQDYSLFPWKSVIDNAAIGLQFSGVPRKERRRRSMEQLRLVGLEQNARSLPGELSGGMQQRVAMVRALAMNPSALLMDEPFGALDEQSRRRLGMQMSAVLTEMSKTVIMVTHSLDEAIFWGDRVLVMGRAPGYIKEVIDVGVPRPRSPKFMTAPEFDEMRARLFELLDVSGSDEAADDATADVASVAADATRSALNDR
jgi:NitT/TauT family transport system ATP-binding protein